MKLQGKPDVDDAIQRVDAWRAGDPTGRPQVIRRMQVAGKGVIVDLHIDELEPIIGAINADALYLCTHADENDQPDIPKRIGRWQGVHAATIRPTTNP